MTGASGYVGSAITRILLARRHEVFGLARSDTARQKVLNLGATPVIGSLSHLDVLSKIVNSCDGVRLPIVYGNGGGPVAQMINHVRSIVVRLPIVYGNGGGPVAQMINQAKHLNKAIYIDDGATRWSTAHITDVAMAYANLLEKSETKGVYHVSDDIAVEMSALASAIAQITAVKAETCPLEQATQKIGQLAFFLARDSVLSASKLKTTGWSPKVANSIGGILGALSNPQQGYLNN